MVQTVPRSLRASNRPSYNETAPEGGVCRFSGESKNARPPAGAAPRPGSRRRKRADLELLLRKPLFFLIFAVQISQKSCRATIKMREIDAALRISVGLENTYNLEEEALP